MVEDSKTWFEIYEVAIAAYEENDKYLNKIENNNNEDKIGAFQFQQLESFETKLTEKIFDLPILNAQTMKVICFPRSPTIQMKRRPLISHREKALCRESLWNMESQLTMM